MNEVKPETPTEAALADAAERIVAAVARPEMKVKHTIASVLRAYHFMLTRTVKWYTPEEAALIVALSSESRGLVLWMNGPAIVAMGTFWPTSNPNVARHRNCPELDMDGQYLYIDWCSGTGDWSEFRRMISYGANVYPKTTHVCCHDGRKRRRGNRVRGSGRLIVRKIHRDPIFGRMTGNGAHG